MQIVSPVSSAPRGAAIIIGVVTIVAATTLPWYTVGGVLGFGEGDFIGTTTGEGLLMAVLGAVMVVASMLPVRPFRFTLIAASLGLVAAGIAFWARAETSLLRLLGIMPGLGFYLSCAIPAVLSLGIALLASGVRK